MMCWFAHYLCARSGSLFVDLGVSFGFCFELSRFCFPETCGLRKSRFVMCWSIHVWLFPFALEGFVGCWFFVVFG